MNTINWNLRNLTVQTHSGLRWSSLDQQLKDWWHSIVYCSELEGLDERSLEDIGMSRCSADSEAAKPFWMA